MHHSINAARHKCAHKAHFLFTFLFSRSLLFFLISVRSHSVAFSPLYIYILSSIFGVFLLFFCLRFSLHFLAFMLKGGPEAPSTQRHGTHTKTQLAQAAHAVVCRELLASRTEMYYCHSKDELPIQHEFNWLARVWWAALLQECVRVCAGYRDPRRKRTDSDWVEIVVSQRQLLRAWRVCATQRWNVAIVRSSPWEILMFTGLPLEYGVFLI